MFADHSNHATSSFTPPWARHLAARVVASISRKGHVPRAEVLPQERSVRRIRGTAVAANPTSQSLSVPPGRRPAFAGRSAITNDELSAQEWLDDRLMAFYHEKHDLWPRVRRFLSGDD